MTDRLTVLIGDNRETMKQIPDGSVQTVVTSPPYFGLRDYGHDGQIGLESTPEEYVAALVAVFRKVRRVLRDDGTVWLNLGDSYAGGGGYCPTAPSNITSRAGQRGRQGALIQGGIKPQGIIKPKDLIGIPWRVAFALQADGWYLRQDIIWHKPNPMPESVTDRCTKAHEYLFLLSKSARYFYDAEAVKEEATDPEYRERGKIRPTSDGGKGFEIRGGLHNQEGGRTTRNRRSVWTVSTRPYSGAHFAVFPPDLIRPAILAGTSERGQCPHCGAPWVRVSNTTDELDSSAKGSRFDRGKTLARDGGDRTQPGGRFVKAFIGWQPSCTCPEHEPVAQTVLDPFGGSGTTAGVALEHGRRAILCELSPAYAKLIPDRIDSITDALRQERLFV